jgi:hypothetical protein
VAIIRTESGKEYIVIPLSPWIAQSNPLLVT